MLRKALLFILYLMFSFSCNLKDVRKEIECSKVHTGNFYVKTESVGKVIIERTRTYQTEIVPMLGKETTFKIKWLNECSFYLTYFKGDTIPGSNGMTPIVCTITEVKEDYHRLEAVIEGTSIKSEYIMYARYRQ